MALIRGPFGTSQIKGSIGAVTFQQGPFGLIARSRTVPVNPASPKQEQARQALNNASILWLGLSISLREEWELYASLTPWSNAFGDPVHLTGRQHFIRVVAFELNTTKTLATVILSGDLIPGIPPPIVPTQVISATTGWDVSALPIPAFGPVPFIHQLRWKGPVSDTVNFFKGSYDHVVLFTDATVLPLEILQAAVLVEGERYFVNYRTFYEGKGLSEQLYAQLTVAA